MRQLYRGLFMAGALAFAQDIWALGLGYPQVSSHLNEPLQARIALLDTQGMSPDEVRVSLADDEAFNAAKIARSAAVDTLRVSVRKWGGQLEIVLEGTHPLREPYLEAMLDVAWPHGQLRRQVTLLLDPPKNVAHQTQETVTSSGQFLGPRPSMSSVSQQAEPQPQRDTTPSHLDRSTPRGNAADVELAALARRLDKLEAKFNELERQSAVPSTDSDQKPAAEWIAPLAALEQTQQRLDDQLNELATRQQVFDEYIAQQMPQQASETPQQAPPAAQISSEPSLHKLWQPVTAWLSPLIIILTGGLLVIVGFLLIRHQRARHDDILPMEFNDPALDREAVESNELDKRAIKGGKLSSHASDGVMASAVTAYVGAGSDVMLDTMKKAESLADTSSGLSTAVEVESRSDDIGDSMLVVYEDIEPEEALSKYQNATESAHNPSTAFDKLGAEAMTNVQDLSASKIQIHGDWQVDAMVLAAEDPVTQGIDPEQGMNAHEFELSFEPGPLAESHMTSAASYQMEHSTSSQAAAFSPSLDDVALDEPLTFTAESDTDAFYSGLDNTSEHVDVIGKEIFPANWSFEEVAFEALEQDNDGLDGEAARDERLIRAHVLLDAGNTDAALILLRQILDEGPDIAREAARLLINRFDVHHPD
ncbi:type IV pilus assembly protein FimV [Phytohalomonas tamaricis]|uniref:type IV pilus assembly protein FimV n=1 Tax=Phytohalomonas tamaricis TaxID=2081032 RepID=UPI000D0B5AE4|nr:hypothetical protein [Phytohalomonas tamaricis]